MASANSLLAPEAIVYVVLDYTRSKKSKPFNNTVHAGIGMTTKTHQFIIFRSPMFPSPLKRPPFLFKRKHLDPLVRHEL